MIVAATKSKQEKKMKENEQVKEHTVKVINTALISHFTSCLLLFHNFLFMYAVFSFLFFETRERLSYRRRLILFVCYCLNAHTNRHPKLVLIQCTIHVFFVDIRLSSFCVFAFVFFFGLVKYEH